MFEVSLEDGRYKLTTYQRGEEKPIPGVLYAGMMEKLNDLNCEE